MIKAIKKFITINQEIGRIESNIRFLCRKSPMTELDYKKLAYIAAMQGYRISDYESIRDGAES